MIRAYISLIIRENVLLHLLPTTSYYPWWTQKANPFHELHLLRLTSTQYKKNTTVVNKTPTNSRYLQSTLRFFFSLISSTINQSFPSFSSLRLVKLNASMDFFRYVPDELIFHILSYVRVEYSLVEFLKRYGVLCKRYKPLLWIQW